MIMAMVLIASVFTAKAQSSFEIKADAFIDEVERLALQGSSHFDYTTLLALADAVVKDPAFESSFGAYISSEMQQRQTTPLQCIGNAASAYSGCLSYYGGGNPGDPPLPPAPPPYTINLCQYHLLNALLGCVGLPALPNSPIPSPKK